MGGADAGAEILVHALASGRGVDRIAERGEIHPLVGAEVADHCRAAMDADAGHADGDAVGVVALAEVLGVGVDLQSAAHRPLAMVALRDRRVEDGHDGVTDELVDGALAVEDDLAGAIEVGIQRLGELLRGEALGQRGEAGDVGEDEADLAAVALDGECLGVVDQLVHHIRRHVAAEGTLHELALLALGTADQRVHHPQREREAERGADQWHQGETIGEAEHRADPPAGDEHGADDDAEGDAFLEEADRHPEQGEGEGERDRPLRAESRMRAPLQQLRDAMRLHHDPGHHAAVVIEHHGAGGAVAVGDGQDATHQYDLAFHPVIGHHRKRVRGVDRERRGLGIRLRAPGDLLVALGRVDAHQLRDLARETHRHAGIGLAGEGPPHGAIERVGDQVGATAVLRRHKIVHVSELVLVHDGRRVAVAEEQRRLDLADGLLEQLVLDLLGRLVEQDVDCDDLGAFLLERLEQVGEERPVDRRAVLELGQGLLVDGGDDHVL